ncbi:MAG: iron ABC transporter permease [Acidimicrobiaceae bacterium]|nr:iron ABC transporter permease [Acidimicrobiaceae bacterium]
MANVGLREVGTSPRGVGWALIERVLGRVARPLLWVVLALVAVVPTVSFLSLAVSPRLFSQGASWFTFAPFSQAFTGFEMTGIRNSLMFATAAGLIAATIAGGLAMIVQRTDLWLARLIPGALWTLLLVPTYIAAVGWEEVLSPSGALARMGLVTPALSSALLGPGGIIFVLAMSGVPFAYFALAPALYAMGRRYEDAARIHGAGIGRTFRTVAPIILPAITSAVVIVFAEALGDFGVASTIAANDNIPVATTNIMAAIATFPTNFPQAAAVSWFLVLTIGTVLAFQSRVLRSRHNAVLSGRSRFVSKSHPTGIRRLLLSLAVLVFFALTIGVPALGSVFSTLLPPGSGLNLSHLTFSAYTSLFHQGLSGPLLVSLRMSLINATLTVVLATAVAKVITSRRPGLFGRLSDVVLIASVALPGLVVAAGFLFIFNLPIFSRLGINLYGTMTLLGMGYLAIALPSNSRVLVGPVAQLDSSLMEAGRLHGASAPSAFRRCVLPLLARPLLWAWLLAFAATFSELPTSEMLAPIGVRTMATAILTSFQNTNLAAATALSVIQMLVVLAVIGIAQVGFRLLAPAGWRHLGGRSQR